jgi:hypothetical protein
MLKWWRNPDACAALGERMHRVFCFTEPEPEPELERRMS